jgi:tRNA dimethylallyltransferase
VGAPEIGKPPIVFLMGPTAAGKTDLALELARRLPFEIISVDSALIYRGMDIGTAKPDPHVLAQVPHRLVDILDPSEAYSAARFRQDALHEIAEIHGRGKVPLLVGGTMLYFRALERGLAELPESDPDVRARLEDELRRDGLSRLHARLADVDPASAARIHANDTQRTLRALEVHELSGDTLSSLLSRGGGEPLPFSVAKWIVAPQDRQRLHARIETRFRQMLEQGFIEEVQALRARGDLDLGKPSMRAVGYRQIWDYLGGCYDYENMVGKGIIATRQYAKRQLTWLRTERDADWFATEDPGLTSGVLARAQALL